MIFGSVSNRSFPRVSAWLARRTCASLERDARPSRRRLVFEAIFYVLRTGCQWKALPTERFGSASAVHKRFGV